MKLFYNLKKLWELNKFFAFKKEKILTKMDNDPYFGDVDEEKYEVTKNSVLPKSICIWGGDIDILYNMKLKVEQMIYNLKKYGHRADMYIGDDDFVLDAINNKTKDGKFFINKISNDFHNPPKDKWTPFYSKDFYYKIINPDNDINTSIVYLSDKKYRGLNKKSCTRNYLNVEINKDFVYYLTCTKIYYPQDIWLRRCYYYTFESRDRKTGEEIIFWTEKSDKQKSIDYLYDRIKFWTETPFSDIIRKFMDFQIDLTELKYLSDDAKSRIQGNRKKITDLLKLRRLLKSLISLDDCDDRYFKMWCIDTLTPEEKRQKMQEAYNFYLEDRKELYKKVFDLLVDRGLTWWD